jgi:hypothetical protein
LSLPFSEKDLTIVLQAVGATSVSSFESVQSLWSGYGEIVRLNLSGASAPSVIVKWIDPSTEKNHPRGWNTNASHQRKFVDSISDNTPKRLNDRHVDKPSLQKLTDNVLP